MTDQDDPQTAAGRAVQAARENANEAVEQAVGMGLFVGLLSLAAILLVVREANLVTYDIPNGLLTTIALVALIVGSAMDTSVVPSRE